MKFLPYWIRQEMINRKIGNFGFATKFKIGGFTEQQAETQARAIAEIVEK